MVTITPEVAADFSVREALLDRAFGKAARRRKTSERLRENRLPSEGLAFAARNRRGRLVGTLRLWDITAGSAGPALLLGPLAVDCAYQKRGIGSQLMRHALAQARKLGHRAVLLVGDAPYYSRFGFTRDGVEELSLPGPVDLDRFLGLELEAGALQDAQGVIVASGRMIPVPAEEAARQTA
ncbi:N-acetyltransferase [Nordella sp. HKS 07]|uniref:GNAT family N-acetyltransferase n=1 Tax=Nordella sp. HKS 07 TaxID=2712222 RepID=UPI0013E1335F|nr:N-acetyltransferase [Nordella sp. HKS 07]QIG50351.1 N-acetyltransferase [Nordella sp. HKS 07]